MKSQHMQELLANRQISQQQWQQAMDSPARVEPINTAEGTYWLKKAAPPRGLFRYHALDAFSRLMRLPLLKAVPQPGGTAAISNEVRRLKQLTAAGVTVPEMLGHGYDWLLLCDAGVCVNRILKDPDTTQNHRQQLFKQCLLAIHQLHQQGQYLSQGFIRNLLMAPDTGRIAFIDFEDDPLEVMSLAAAQARDVLLLVNSTARFFLEDLAFFEATIQAVLNNHDPQVVEALRITTKRMQWVTRIPFQGLFGHDYQKLKTGILALNQL
jgi:tRNA A-37 threonylcarbamoyl transferase component Bud32